MDDQVIYDDDLLSYISDTDYTYHASELQQELQKLLAEKVHRLGSAPAIPCVAVYCHYSDNVVTIIRGTQSIAG